MSTVTHHALQVIQPWALMGEGGQGAVTSL